ncbi:MAG: twin-arginine translocase subunit TatC [Candidatus Aminicenantes bacterium]|nr:twin-arginine translocase subunit TatC [Candidatus Aminicenantes bacterium]
MKKRANEMTFFEHLGELRKRLLFSIVFIFIFFLVSWFFVDKTYYLLSKPVLRFLPEGKKLAFTALTDPFMMYIKLAFISGLFIASPFVFHQFWLFLAPGLFPKEKKLVFPFVFFTTVFFIAGGAFGYLVVFPFACEFFLEIGKDFEAIITIDKYFALAFRVLLGISVVFEMPVLSFLLAKLRVISARFLIKYFKYAVVIIFIIAAVITPTPDMITQSIFAVPMLLLYLLSILIAKIVGPKSEEE